MNEPAQVLYNKLKTDVTNTRLNEAIKRVIALYKSKNFTLLRSFAIQADLTIENQSANKIFAQLIKVYHPDKLVYIHKEIDNAYQTKNLDILTKFHRLYLEEHKTADIDVDYEEEYDLSPDDYVAYEEPASTEDFELEDNTDVFEEEYGTCLTFLDIMNKEFYRIFDDGWDLGTLRCMEGELQLQNLKLFDLTGIEVCTHLTSLNLSGNKLEDVDILTELLSLESLYLSENQIEDISFLSELSSLKELDLSFNQISDISPLLLLPELQYVNLIGNPVTDEVTLELLGARAITIII